MLNAWVQAQQALVVARMEELMARAADVERLPEKDRPSSAFDLAAAEVGSVLQVPHVTAQRVVAESGLLVRQLPATLARLSAGRITYSHARVVLDEIRFVPAEDAKGFEAEVLDAVKDRTAAQLARKARVMRERRYPETVPERHGDALSKRRVWLEPAPDGMASLTALLAAEKAQAMFNTLTTAARARRRAGDHRTQDQLRADLFAASVLGRRPAAEPSGGAGGEGARVATGACAGGGAGAAGGGTAVGDGAPVGAGRGAGGGAAPTGAADSGEWADKADWTDNPEDLPGMRTELMVIISAETLLGADDRPAELNGYGPISADAARRLIRTVKHWTGLVQDSATGEILAVGRRRKVPAGLARWLQARDGTCRFPGCSVNAVRAGMEIDHTVPWSHGGATEHGNLEYLCPKHHRMKSQGFWKARQNQPGDVEWLSPLARRYGSEPQLKLKPPPTMESGRESTALPSGSGNEDIPPPF
ncbi:HNH endonuclease [Arthrobacter saudimassiliensis]|uniref:HNH endonuclease n=1 Tax=Arthrobacter saudimassiliensis TaxID=1461584 RepID=A0A078MT10_9MICC|nr:HNH endonuclease [Arthrobacter saudimassiliensis]